LTAEPGWTPDELDALRDLLPDPEGASVADALDRLETLPPEALARAVVSLMGYCASASGEPGFAYMAGHSGNDPALVSARVLRDGAIRLEWLGDEHPERRAAGAGVLADARRHMPGEPYPLDEPLADWERDVLAEQCAEPLRLLADVVAQAEADVLYVKHEIISIAEIRKLRYGLDGNGAAPAHRLRSQQPWPGHRVHFAADSGCLPATVRSVSGETVTLDPDPQPGNVTSVLYDVPFSPGAHTAGPRTAVPGEPFPLITYADLTFEPGTWHWPSGDPA
jgi:hypothetical protein